MKKDSISVCPLCSNLVSNTEAQEGGYTLLDGSKVHGNCFKASKL